MSTLARSGHRAVYLITSAAPESSGGGTGEAQRLRGLEIDGQFEIGRVTSASCWEDIMRIVSLAACFCAAFVLQSPASAQAPTAIRIGILNDQAGPYADFGGKTSATAAQMAIEDFGGKVLGKPVEIVVADHQNKPDVAASIARRWFDTENVSAIADLTNSGVALAVQKIASDHGKVTLAVGPATTRLTNEDCSATGFHWAFDTYSQAVGTARAIVAQGGKSWFILTADYAFGHQMAADLSRVVKRMVARYLARCAFH
jgi:branched-chain amino acid transport system substrate-binding protein